MWRVMYLCKKILANQINSFQGINKEKDFEMSVV
jgi:hypothetical protein